MTPLNGITTSMLRKMTCVPITIFDRIENINIEIECLKRQTKKYRNKKRYFRRIRTYLEIDLEKRKRH